MRTFDYPKWDRKKMIVPFQDDCLADRWEYNRSIDWRQVFPFDSEMEIVGWSNGNSTSLVNMKDSEGITYSMYMVDFYEVITKRNIIGGKVERSKWTFRKQGKVYTIMPDFT